MSVENNKPCPVCGELIARAAAKCPNCGEVFLGLSTSQLPGPNYKWWVVGMLWFICFFNYADRMALNAVAPILEKEPYNFSKQDIGLIISAFMWIYALSAPFAGQVGDKVRRKTLILGGLFVWSVVTGATALCTKVKHFALVRGAEGLGETFYFPATMSLVSDYHTKRTRSRAMGLHQSSVYVGTIGGAIWLAGKLAEHYGWQSPFWFFGICGIVLSLLLMAFLREPTRNEAERMESGVTAVHVEEPKAIPIMRFLGELVHTPSALLLLLAFCGANSVGIGFISWMPLHLHDNFGMSLAEAGFFATFYQQVGSAIGAISGGVLADQFRKFLPGGRILTQAIGAVLAIPLIYLAGYTTDFAPRFQQFFSFTQDLDPQFYAKIQLAVFLSLLGLAKGIYDANIWASMYDVVHPSRRATMLGLGNMVGWGAAGLLTYAIGVLTTAHGAEKSTMSMGQALGSTSVIYAFVAVVLIAAFLCAPRDIRRAATTEELPPVPA